MNITLRKVGNSHAVIIPKAVLMQLGLKDTLDMQIQDDRIVLSKPRIQVREGWEQAAKEIAQANDDELLLDLPLESGDEWIW